MGREQTVIENPILNGPFTEPARHFEFDEDGIIDRIAEGRRPSSYFVPISTGTARSWTRPETAT